MTAVIPVGPKIDAKYFADFQSNWCFRGQDDKRNYEVLFYSGQNVTITKLSNVGVTANPCYNKFRAFLQEQLPKFLVSLHDNLPKFQK